MLDPAFMRYAQLAGIAKGRDRAEANFAQQSAQAQMRSELDRQRAEMKRQQDEQRRNWWKQLIPGALGVIGTGAGMALGGPGVGKMVGGMLGGSIGGLLGSGIAAQQGVPGAAANFNAMSPMMMQAMLAAGRPGLFGSEGGDGFTKPPGAGLYHGATTSQDLTGYVNPPMAPGHDPRSLNSPNFVGPMPSPQQDYANHLAQQDPFYDLQGMF